MENYKVAICINNHIYKEGRKVYLVECTNGVVNGYHVFLQANNDRTWICNISRDRVSKFLKII